MDLVEVETVASQTLLLAFVPYSSMPGYAKSLDLAHVQNEEAYLLMLHTLNQLKRYKTNAYDTKQKMRHRLDIENKLTKYQVNKM